MEERSGNGHAPAAALRRQAVAAIRKRNAALVSALSADLCSQYPNSLNTESAQSTAALILTLLTSAIEGAELNPRAGAVHDLERLCGLLGTRKLFHAVDHACQIISDGLALDDRFGATSEPWPVVVSFVRRAAFDVLAAFTTRLLDTPAHGSVHDPLTTLVARPVFDLALAQEARRAVRHHGTFAVILFDVDDLSGINRAHGYGVGDRVLERLGILARRFFRTHDWVARHDEDSIVVLLPDTSLDQAAQLATRFRHTVEQRLSLVDEKTEARAAITLSASAVAAGQVQTELQISEILTEAETAVARAKLDGRRRTECVALAPTSVTILSAASLLDRSVGEMRRLVRSGELKATRRGRHFHVDRADIDRLLAAARGART